MAPNPAMSVPTPPPPPPAPTYELNTIPLETYRMRAGAEAATPLVDLVPPFRVWPRGIIHLKTMMTMKRTSTMTTPCRGSGRKRLPRLLHLRQHRHLRPNRVPLSRRRGWAWEVGRGIIIHLNPRRLLRRRRAIRLMILLSVAEV